MAVGDYVVRSNTTSTDTVPDAGSDLLLTWNNAVDNVGSGITYDAGTFTLGETGKFLVMCSDNYNTTDTTNNERINSKTTFTLNSTELTEGYSTIYLRKSSGHVNSIAFSAAIIHVTSTTGAADDLEVRTERIDSTVTAGRESDRVADRSSITIIKLDDDLAYGRYESSAAFTTTGTDNTDVEANLQTEVETEEAPFSRTTNTITISTSNLVLAVYSVKSEDDTPTGRFECQSFLELNGAAVPGSWTTQYMRTTDNTDWCGSSNVCLLEPTSGWDLTLQVRSREGGANDFTAALQLVELPAGAEAAIYEATTGDYHPTSATDFVWDTVQRGDTDFSTGATQANIDVDTSGDYIVAYSQSIITAAGAAITQRAEPSGLIRVNTTDTDIGSHSHIHRSNGTADHSSVSGAGLLTGLSASDSVIVRNTRMNTTPTGAVANGEGAFSVIRLTSLAPASGATGTAVQVLPSITQAAVGEQPEEGTATQTLGSLTQAGTGIQHSNGTATQTLGSLTQSATGGQDVLSTARKRITSLGFPLRWTSTLPDPDGSNADDASQRAKLAGDYGEHLLAVGATTGTATQTLASLTQAGTGVQTHSATATQTLPSLTQSATGNMLFSGTATQTLASLTQSGTGVHKQSGTAVQTLPSLTQAGTGVHKQTATATQTLASLTQSGTGVMQPSATATQTLASLTQSGTGVQTHSGTASQTLASLTQAGTGHMHPTATATQTLPSLTQSGTATVAEVVGTATQTLPSLTQSGIGNMVPSGTATQTLASLIQTATGVQTHSGTGTQTLPSLTQSGVGVMHPTASASQTLPSLTQAGTGIHTQSGTAVQTLPSLTQVGTAAMNPSGTAVQTLGKLTQLATGVQIYSATSAQTLPSLTQSGTGLMQPSGTAVQTLASLTQAATGVHKHSGTAAQTLPALTQSSTGVMLPTGTGTQTLPSLIQTASGAHGEPTATATQILPSLTQLATGVMLTTGTAIQVLASLTQSATGTATEAGGFNPRLFNLRSGRR